MLPTRQRRENLFWSNALPSCSGVRIQAKAACVFHESPSETALYYCTRLLICRDETDGADFPCCYRFTLMNWRASSSHRHRLLKP